MEKNKSDIGHNSNLLLEDALKETIKDASTYEEARKFAEAASQIKVTHEEEVQTSTAKSY